MTTHEKRLQLAIRNHTINVLRECATQTHTDWEKYVKKSEAKAMKEFLDLINQARIEELENFVPDKDFKIALAVPYSFEWYQGYEACLTHIKDRIQALKEGK